MEKKYIVIIEETDKITDTVDRYCYIMDEPHYDHFKRSKGFYYSPYALTDKGTFEKETIHTHEKIVVDCFKEENVFLYDKSEAVYG